MLSCFSEKKWTNFNSTHRRIHLHKASPISYNPPPKSTSDLTSAFYLCRLRSGAALWTWQIAYWSADVVVNVLSTWAAAAVACSLQPVLSPEHLQLSPLPPSLLPHHNSPLPSCYEGAPPPPLSHTPHRLPATLLIPPCPPRCGKGHRQTPSAPAGRKWQVRPALGHVTPYTGQLWPLKTRSGEDLWKNKKPQLSTLTNQQWESRDGKREKN